MLPNTIVASILNAPIAYKYGDWIYQLKNRNFEVEWPKEIELPKSVFKYYANTDYSIDAIIKQYLFCSHPYHLNDSIDSTNSLWDFNNINEETFEGFYHQYGLEKAYEVNFEKEKETGFSAIKQRFYDMVSKNAGIISLTSEPLQTLMWAHYSTERGFMVELDWNLIRDNLKRLNPKLNNYAFFPINYVDNLESVDFFGNGFKSADLPYIYSTGVKRKDWAYEKEWRLISFTLDYGVPNSILGPFPDIPCLNERKVFYPKDAIKSITLGKQFFNGANLEKVIDEGTYVLKEKRDLEFLKYLMANFNDRIFLCGEYEKDRIFKRSAGKIHLENIGENTFKIMNENEGFYKK